MIKIYTDGGFSVPNNRGGWAFIVVDTDKPKGDEVIYKYNEKSTNSTNNKMELSAFLAALKYVKKYGNVSEIISDSTYVVKGYNIWCKNWSKSEWVKGDGKEVKNCELWKEIDSLRFENLTVKWTKAHSKDDSEDTFYNNIVDELTR